MLEGNAINLVGAEPEDIPLLFEWHSNLRVQGRYNPIFLISKHELEKSFSQSSPDQKIYLIENKEGQKIGLVSYYEHKPLKLLEIGFIIIPSERNKGYCTEAIKLFVDYLFLRDPIERIQSSTDERNIPSQKTLDKAGFSFEGTVRKAMFMVGEWVNLKQYSILREEWNGPHILNLNDLE